MSDCIFCKIVAGELPSSNVYEDEDVLAFLTIEPVNKGHTLVIPKAHYVTVMDTPDDLLKQCIVVVKKIAVGLMKETEGITLGQNNFEAGGQAVPHLHFHVIPRQTEDPHEHNWALGSYEEGEKDKWARNIKSLLNDS